MKEPLAAVVLPGGTLALETQAEDGTAFGKPIVAHLLRVFTFREPDRATDGRDIAVDKALETGWKVNLNGDDSNGPLFGAKTLPTGAATLIIGAYNDDGIHKVSIRLEHRKCQRERCGRS